MSLTDRIVICTMFIVLKFDDMISNAHGPLANIVVFVVGVSLAILIAILWNGAAKEDK